jgi:hypothetical protein
MKTWKRIPILLNLPRLENAIILDNITSLIVKHLVRYGGFIEMEIANKLVCFRTNGVNVFQGVKVGVTTQLMMKHVPYVNGVHCMAHHTNLVVQTLGGLSLVTKTESLLSFTYNYFTHSPKRHVELMKLFEFLECKGTTTIKVGY